MLRVSCHSWYAPGIKNQNGRSRNTEYVRAGKGIKLVWKEAGLFEKEVN
jgi:hypothetical protein